MQTSKLKMSGKPNLNLQNTPSVHVTEYRTPICSVWPPSFAKN